MRPNVSLLPVIVAETIQGLRGAAVARGWHCRLGAFVRDTARDKRALRHAREQRRIQRISRHVMIAFIAKKAFIACPVQSE